MEPIMSNKSFLSGLIEARQRQADRYINGYLLTLDDKTLERSGFNRKEIIKKGSSFYPL